jgi:hypothetical protein
VGVISEMLSNVKEGLLNVAPGLGNIGSDVMAEVGRLATQGQAEIGSFLFTGNGYVPYGQGQNRDTGKDGNEGLDAPKNEAPQQEFGREM